MTANKTARKERPIARGVFDYFPDAIAEVAHVSFIGNQQHNPGEEMHWDKSKSPDHADCIARHLIERGTLDDDGLRHSAKVAWRALAMLQIELDQDKSDYELQMDAAASEVGAPDPDEETHLALLASLGCPEKIAKQVVYGITFAGAVSIGKPFVYIAGPMRGIEKFNFPAFDATRDRFVAKGFNVISPADIDRASGFNEGRVYHNHELDQKDFAFRDFWALYFLAKQGNPRNGIVLLPGWEESVGASAEFFLARWLGLSIYNQYGDKASIASALDDFIFVHGQLQPPEGA